MEVLLKWTTTDTYWVLGWVDWGSSNVLPYRPPLSSFPLINASTQKSKERMRATDEGASVSRSGEAEHCLLDMELDRESTEIPVKRNALTRDAGSNNLSSYTQSTTKIVCKKSCPISGGDFLVAHTSTFASLSTHTKNKGNKISWKKMQASLDSNTWVYN